LAQIVHVRENPRDRGGYPRGAHDAKIGRLDGDEKKEAGSDEGEGDEQCCDHDEGFGGFAFVGAAERRFPTTTNEAGRTGQRSAIF
jgi:hypothetical protein